jgi:hypothetical protein
MQQQVLVLERPKQTQEKFQQTVRQTETCWTRLFSYIRGLCCWCVEVHDPYDLR